MMRDPMPTLTPTPIRTRSERLTVAAAIAALAGLTACTPDQPPRQVIDISQIGPILNEIRQEVASYNTAIQNPPGPYTARVTPGGSPPAGSPVPGAVTFVLPGPPVTPERHALDIRATAQNTSLCKPISGHLKIKSITLSITVSTDRTLTGGIAATIPVTPGITIGGGPNLSRENTSTETLQYTEYPVDTDATTITATPNGNGLAQALIALDNGLYQQNDGAGPCFSPTPTANAISNPLGPNQISFATNASRNANGGLTLTLGVIGLNAADISKRASGNTITIVFNPT